MTDASIEEDVLVGPKDLKQLFGDHDATTTWRRTKRPEFPSPIKLPGSHGRRWWKSEVLAYIQAHQVTA